MSAHARLSPSSAHRWVRCAGSVREESVYPNDSNKYSIDGTHTHTLLEKSIENGLFTGYKVDVFKMFVGKTLTDHDGSFVVDKERSERVQVATDYVASVYEQHKCYVMPETRIDSSLAFLTPDLSGTVDILLHGTRHFEVVDYKDGIGFVDVEENDQLVIYGLNAFKSGLTGRYKDVKEIKLTVIQPKNKTRGLPVINSWSFPVEQIDSRIEFYKEKAELTKNPDALLTPGEKQCKWCKHRANCATKGEYVMEKADIQVISFLPTLTEQASEKNPSVMTNEKLKELMEAAPLIRGFLDDVETELYKRVETGICSDYKLVTGRGSRSWAFDEEKIAEVLKKMGVPKTAIYETKMVSPAKAEKITWNATSKGENVVKTLSKNQIEMLKKEYIVTVAGKPTLAPASDPRPAINNDASSLFKPIVDENPLPSWLIGAN